MKTIAFTPDKTRPRKHLAHTIANVLEVAVTYAGTPSFAYHIGQLALTRDWQLTTTRLTNTQIQAIVDATKAAGYTLEQNADSSADSRVTLVLPMTNWDATTAGKLETLLASKRALIEKALAIPEAIMHIDTENSQVIFPWFPASPDRELVEAASCLLEHMITYATTTTRISAKNVEVANERYAMRCWLLRLGMIGANTKHARHVLLRNLEGNSAWKNPPA